MILFLICQPSSIILPQSINILVTWSLQFSDGVHRDFTTNARTTYTIVQSQDQCIITRDSSGIPWVQATANATRTSGTCVVQAAVTFHNSTITATTIVHVATADPFSVYLLEENVPALPERSATAETAVHDGETVRLLQCGWGVYDQVRAVTAIISINL